MQRDPHDFLGLKVAGLVFFLKTLGERIVMIIMIIAIIMILIIIIMMLAIMRLRKYIYIYTLFRHIHIIDTARGNQFQGHKWWVQLREGLIQSKLWSSS